MATIAEAFAEAVKYHMSGSLAQAERIYDQIIRADPEHAEALNLRGIIAYQTGNLGLAVAALSRAVALNDTNVGFLNNLGVILAACGRQQEAETCYRKALALAPDFADAHGNLGNTLRALGRVDEAIASYRQALIWQPDHADALNNLGNALMEQGKLEEAIHCFRQAVQSRPTFAQALSNLGTALREQHRFAEAVEAYQSALQHQPRFVEVHANLGCTLRDMGRLRDAAAAHRQALQLNPNHAEAHNGLGNVRYDQGRVEEARACFREAIRLKPDYAEAYYNLGTACRDLGEFAEAAAHFKAAIHLKPTMGHAYYNLAQLAVRGYYAFSADELETLKTLLVDDTKNACATCQSPGRIRLATDTFSQLSAVDRCLLHYAFADILDKLDRCEEAFEHYRRANDLRRLTQQQQGRGFVADKHIEQVSGIIATFDRLYFERVRTFGLDTELPVFVVGMPRSGTTLVEQILASHPQVFGAGEFQDMPRLADEASRWLGVSAKFPQSFSGITAEVARYLAQTYLARITKRASDSGKSLDGASCRVVDKLPRNRRYLGVIHTLFPRARIIHCRRQPLDTCFSLYAQHFEHLNFSTSFDDIALMYGLYEKMMAHWRRVLPCEIMEVQYEELVENQEAVSRKLIAFCGLEWDDRCLTFHETRRGVQTASALQVRQPMYRNSVGRWQRYKLFLRPLITALAAHGVSGLPDLK